MDKKLIQQYGQSILCYRIRTARQKTRMQYEDFHKQLIKLNKEEDALRTQRWNLGWEPLVPPVQKGWMRCFVLRDDVAKSKQAEFFESLLAKINTYGLSHRKDFKVKKRRKGRKWYVVKEQKLLSPTRWHFAWLKFSEAEKQMFHEVLHWDRKARSFTKTYVFNEPWRFVLKVKPNMITKVRIRDAELDARIRTIENYMTGNDLRKQQSKALGESYNYWRKVRKCEEKNPLLNKPVYRIIDEMKEQFLIRQ